MLRELQKELQAALGTPVFDGLFRALKKRSSAAHRFESWRELLTWFRSQAGSRSDEDEVLSALLEWHAVNGSTLVRSVITLIMVPALARLFGRGCSWTERVDELWSNLYWTFIESVSKYDVQKRQSGIFWNLHDDTLWRLRRLCLRSRLTVEREQPSGTMTDVLDTGPECAVEVRDEARHLAFRLHWLASSGRLNPADLELIIETRSGAQSLSAAAAARGITYRAALVRRRRAEVGAARLLQDCRNSEQPCYMGPFSLPSVLIGKPREADR